MARKENTYRSYHRSFLNEEEGTAFCATSINESDYGQYVDASIELSDCCRQISLEFDFDATDKPDKGSRTRKEVLHKCDLLLSMIQRFRNELAEIEVKPVPENKEEK